MENWNANNIQRIVVINGSPKKTNSATMQVTNAFVKGICEVTNAKVDVIHLSELTMKPCTGCLSCWGRTEGECVIHNDDLPRVKKLIEAADIVIESFPLYFFGMPGIMKVFTDRMLGMMCTYRGQSAPQEGLSFHGIRNPKYNQRLVVISSCAYSEADQVYEPLLKQYDCICGQGKYTPIFCPQLKTLIDLKNDNKINRYLEKFILAGTTFAKAGKLSDECLKDLKKPPFSQGAYKVFLNNFWTEEKKS